MKQQQHHGPRAPHGKPQKTERFGVRLSPDEKKKVMRKGGGAWLRQLIKEA